MTDNASSPSKPSSRPAQTPQQEAGTSASRWEPDAVRPENTLGLVAFVIGLVGVFIDVLQSIALFLFARYGGPLPYAFVDTFGTYLIGVIGAVALVLGVIALLRRGVPRGFAAAATALGGTTVLFVLLGLVENLLLVAFR
jgi:hypothetical protein